MRAVLNAKCAARAGDEGRGAGEPKTKNDSE